jgi:hypothetical protein
MFPRRAKTLINQNLREYLTVNIWGCQLAFTVLTFILKLISKKFIKNQELKFHKLMPKKHLLLRSHQSTRMSPNWSFLMKIKLRRNLKTQHLNLGIIQPPKQKKLLFIAISNQFSSSRLWRKRRQWLHLLHPQFKRRIGELKLRIYFR